MAALTAAQLRSLVRMYRRHVDGAREQLEELVSARPDVVAELLGLPRETLARVLARHDPAEAVSQLLEHQDDARRRDGKAEALASTRKAADALAASARWEGARAHLDPRALGTLLAARAVGELCFERDDSPPGVVPLAYLRALFRECRACRMTDLYLEDHHLVLAYSANGARGRFRLVLAPPQQRMDQVPVRLPARTPARPEAPAGATHPVTVPTVARAPRPAAHRFLDALSAEVGR